MELGRYNALYLRTSVDAVTVTVRHAVTSVTCPSDAQPPPILHFTYFIVTFIISRVIHSPSFFFSSLPRSVTHNYAHPLTLVHLRLSRHTYNIQLHYFHDQHIFRFDIVSRHHHEFDNNTVGICILSRTSTNKCCKSRLIVLNIVHESNQVHSPKLPM
jgi:hypothetical protein